MDNLKVKALLEQWTDVVDIGEQRSIKKVSKNPHGLNMRIKRTIGRPVIFDFDTHEQQLKVQDALCRELPHLADIIRSQPELMDGHAWTRKDFIELYYGHFRLVIRKIQRITAMGDKHNE